MARKPTNADEIENYARSFAGLRSEKPLFGKVISVDDVVEQPTVTLVSLFEHIQVSMENALSAMNLVNEFSEKNNKEAEEAGELSTAELESRKAIDEKLREKEIPLSCASTKDFFRDFVHNKQQDE